MSSPNQGLVKVQRREAPRGAELFVDNVRLALLRIVLGDDGQGYANQHHITRSQIVISTRMANNVSLLSYLTVIKGHGALSSSSAATFDPHETSPRRMGMTGTGTKDEELSVCF
ncbi:hypothetical protein ABKN59_007724 [Abortiporus biennis]